MKKMAPIFDKLRRTAQDLKREIDVYRRALKDRWTPKIAKLFLGLAVGYMLLPFDIIPDFIPVIGHLADLIIVPALIAIALKMIPKEVIEDCRKPADNQLGDISYPIGQRMLTVVPRPSVLSISIVQPCALTRCLTIARPRPVPPSSLERARSTL
jgi:uncharacterized membrane protein YkvA (DUF1232 family)